jgi:hypothetical protein
VTTITSTQTLSSREQAVSATPNRFEASDEAVKVFRRILRGRVILPGDEGYDENRQLRMKAIDRRPAMIVQAANAADVAQAVRFARDFDLTISVRSGGHSFAGHSTNDNGIVIDLRNMKNMVIDPDRKVARAQPGLTSAELGAQAQAFGLALSTGDTSSVALGGLVLGGGIGWMARKQGLTIDNLLSAEVVTADAEVVTASPDENPDLFWAIRGGGGNFGIVTEYELQLHDVGMVLGGVIALPATREAVRGYLDWAMKAPDEMTTITPLMKAPPAPFVPADEVGRVSLLVVFCYTGDLAEGEVLLDGLRAVATPRFEFVSPMPYPAIYAFTEEGTHRALEAARSVFLKEMPDEIIDATLEAMEQASPTTMVQLRVLGGQVARTGKGDTAFAHRDKPYLWTAVRQWTEDDDAGAEAGWVYDLFEHVQPYGTGVYVNFLIDEPGRIGDAYPMETYQRLADVKLRFDPQNVFSQNQNVKPRLS